MKQQISEKARQIEEIIGRYLPKEDGFQKTVLEAMNYTMNAGGKRLRPMLMQETYKFFGGEESIIEPFMVAIEMIHTYSLIHDDLPALDNDDYRRGRKTAHVVYGEAMAILAGDGLLNYAFETAGKAFLGRFGDEKIAKAFLVLARKPGIYGMIGGQTADIELTGKKMTMEQLQFIYELKTGALLEASMMIGAILAGRPEEDIEKIEQIARKIGIAFQIQDDILDITSTVEELGKPIHSDEKNEKVTYVTIHGLEKSKEEVTRLTNEAIGILDSFSFKNEFLRNLLLYLVDRTN
ncbi:MAG: polyprenyl synthetase family protein [Lachnospiraceae bacterium]